MLESMFALETESQMFGKTSNRIRENLFAKKFQDKMYLVSPECIKISKESFRK